MEKLKLWKKMEHEWIVFGKEKKSKRKMRNGKDD